MAIVVTELNFYPVKSCAGTALESAQVGEKGIKYDRHWLLVDANGKAITQRDFPQMALVKPVVETTNQGSPATLGLSAPLHDTIKIEETQDGDRINVEIWGDICKAVDQGNEAAQWFSHYLQCPCRLVVMASEHMRQVEQKYATSDSDQVGFADGYPLLLLSQESLTDLNSRLDEPLPMNRFRPNVVVSGCHSYAEDTWHKIRIGSISFTCAKLCARCVMTTINQSNATKGSEPLKTMAKYRNVENKLMFGVNLIHHSEGQIAVGDRVELLD